MAKAVEQNTQRCYQKLQDCAEDGLLGKIQDKALTGKTEPMVLNGIFLLREEKIEKFLNEIERLGREMKPKGFTLEYSGPWPAYNFTGGFSTTF